MPMGSQAGEWYRAGDLCIDVGGRTVYRDGVDLEIAGLTFDLLLCLVRQAPGVVSHEFLLAEVWQDAFVGEETLKQRVRLLRKALGDRIGEPRYIRTVRGRGYQMVAATETVTAGPTPAAKRDRRRSFLLGGILLAAASLLVWFLIGYPQGPKLTRKLSGHASAGELYERAKAYYFRYLPRDNETAIQLLNRAVTAEPEFAEAHALLSRAYSQQPKLGNGYWGEESLAAAERAIALAGDEADGYLSLGVHYDVAGRPSKGIEAYRLALEKEPDEGVAMANAAYDFMCLGRLDEALALNVRGMELVPDIQFGMVQMGEILRRMDELAAAESWFRKAMALQPDNIFARTGYSRLLLLSGKPEQALAMVGDEGAYAWGDHLALSCRADACFVMGDLEGARTAYQAAWDGGELRAGCRLGLVLSRLGSPTGLALLVQCEAETRQLIADGNEVADCRLDLAGVVAEQGRLDEAMTWLAAAQSAGWTDVRWLDRDPALASLRDHPQFQSIRDGIEADVAAMRNKAAGLISRLQETL